MCLTSITIRISNRRRCNLGLSARRCNLPNLRYPTLSTYTDLEVMGGLGNCQLAVKKADSISANTSLLTISTVHRGSR
ncbi:unnamed protein product [Lota lota]